jgi:hypothetical protein
VLLNLANRPLFILERLQARRLVPLPSRPQPWHYRLTFFTTSHPLFLPSSRHHSQTSSPQCLLLRNPAVTRIPLLLILTWQCILLAWYTAAGGDARRNITTLTTSNINSSSSRQTSTHNHRTSEVICPPALLLAHIPTPRLSTTHINAIPSLRHRHPWRSRSRYYRLFRVCWASRTVRRPRPKQVGALSLPRALGGCLLWRVG